MNFFLRVFLFCDAHSICNFVLKKPNFVVGYEHAFKFSLVCFYVRMWKIIIQKIKSCLKFLLNVGLLVLCKDKLVKNELMCPFTSMSMLWIQITTRTKVKGKI
jgi:hypothetical protein